MEEPEESEPEEKTEAPKEDLSDLTYPQPQVQSQEENHNFDNSPKVSDFQLQPKIQPQDQSQALI